MITPRDFIKRMGVGGSLVSFFMCVCVYLVMGGSDVPSLGAVAAKCAPVLCLLLAVALHLLHKLPPHQQRYARCVCVGLALSAVGDALLVWPGQLMAGMAAFASAHVAYLAALGRGPLAPVRGAICLMAAAVYVRVACGGARGAMGTLVPMYATLLAVMSWRALARGGAAAVGGLLFLVSDALLGYAMFSGAIPHRRLLVMSTYYLGQLGLTLSALRQGPVRVGAL